MLRKIFRIRVSIGVDESLNKVVTIQLSNRVFQALEKQAEREDVSVQELLRTLVIPEWFQTETRNREENAFRHVKRSTSLGELGKAILDLKIDEKRGIVTLWGERIFLVPARIIQSIEDWVSKAFGHAAAVNFLYEMGREAGKNSVKALNDFGFVFKNPFEFQKAREELAPFWGWEKLNTVEFDVAGRLVRSRCTGSAYVCDRNARTPVCHLGRGFDAGALEVVFGKRCESIETACEGKKDDYCELVTGSSAEVAQVAEEPLLQRTISPR